MPIPIWLIYSLAATATFLTFTTSTAEVVDAVAIGSVGVSAGTWWLKLKKFELSQKFNASRVQKAIARVNQVNKARMPLNKRERDTTSTKANIRILNKIEREHGFEDMHYFVGDVHVHAHAPIYGNKNENEHGQENEPEHEHEHEERKRTKSATARTAKWRQR